MAGGSRHLGGLGVGFRIRLGFGLKFRWGNWSTQLFYYAISYSVFMRVYFVYHNLED